MNDPHRRNQQPDSYMDDSQLDHFDQEDLENREKPKVTYICGGNKHYS